VEPAGDVAGADEVTDGVDVVAAGSGAVVVSSWLGTVERVGVGRLCGFVDFVRGLGDRSSRRAVSVFDRSCDEIEMTLGCGVVL